MMSFAQATEPIAIASGSSLADIASTHAVRYMVKDMGNGVLRCYSPSILPIAAARAAACSPDRSAIDPPNRAALRNLTLAALASLGIRDVEALRVSPSEIYAKVIDDSTVDILKWFAQAAATIV
jgi:hypothetical protein